MKHLDEDGNVIAEYDDGDQGVYVHDTGTTKEQIDEQRAGGLYTGGEGNYIGDIGGQLDVNLIFVNMILKNIELAKKIESLKGYADMVKTGAPWDLKNNKQTVFGIAWAYQLANSGKFTQFVFGDYTFEDASDVGNYHAGYMGTYLKDGAGFNPALLYAGAGVAETWKDLKSLELWNVYSQTIDLIFAIPPYGDEGDDHSWNRLGILDATKSKNE